MNKVTFEFEPQKVLEIIDVLSSFQTELKYNPSLFLTYGYTYNDIDDYIKLFEDQKSQKELLQMEYKK